MAYGWMLTEPGIPTVWYCGEWVVRIGALVVVPRGRPAAETRAWLLLIFFLPVVGLVLFAGIGSVRYPGWRRKRFVATSSLQSAILSGLAPLEPHLGRGAPVAALAKELGDLPAVGGNTAEMMQDYDAVIDRLVSDIDEAAHSVHVLVYIFADDSTGARVAAALGRAVARGVEVRVMLDPVGSRPWLRGTLDLLRSNHVPLLRSLPLRLLSHRTRRDMRNHRKVIVIDDRIGYAGSQNIVDKDFRPGVVNRELVVRLTGPIVAALAVVVHRDWAIEMGKEYGSRLPSFDASGTAVVQLLPTGPSYPLPGFETLLIWQLHQAVRRAVIVTPYFIPSESLIDAMRTAVARGVTVELVVSKTVDQMFVNWAQSSYYETVVDAGVRVNLFRGYLLHAKNVSIDSCLAIVGSSNVDIRSFELNEEVSLLFYDTSSIDEVIGIQDAYLAGSDRIDIRRWRRRSGLRKLAENLAQIASPLL